MSSESKVREAAKLVHLSNRISQMHEKNMKLYPYVFFEDVESVKIDYDLSNRIADDTPADTPKKPDDYYKDIVRAAKRKANCFVSYDLKLKEESNTHLNKRFEAIEKAIRDLFWSDVSVEIYFNGDIKFKSKKVEK